MQHQQIKQYQIFDKTYCDLCEKLNIPIISDLLDNKKKYSTHRLYTVYPLLDNTIKIGSNEFVEQHQNVRISFEFNRYKIPPILILSHLDLGDYEILIGEYDLGYYKSVMVHRLVDKFLRDQSISPNNYTHRVPFGRYDLYHIAILVRRTEYAQMWKNYLSHISQTSIYRQISDEINRLLNTQQLKRQYRRKNNLFIDQLVQINEELYNNLGEYSQIVVEELRRESRNITIERKSALVKLSNVRKKYNNVIQQMNQKFRQAKTRTLGDQYNDYQFPHARQKMFWNQQTDSLKPQYTDHLYRILHPYQSTIRPAI